MYNFINNGIMQYITLPKAYLQSVKLQIMPFTNSLYVLKIIRCQYMVMKIVDLEFEEDLESD